MKRIKLAKKNFEDNRVVLIPGYISSGAWAVKREFVLNADDFTGKSFSGLPVLEMNDINPDVFFTGDCEYRRTGYILDYGDRLLARVFTAVGREPILLDEKLVQLFDAHLIYAAKDPGSPCMLDGKEAVVMPLKASPDLMALLDKIK